MKILNIAGYKFTTLNDLNALCSDFLMQLQALEIKGTILLSHEGININLAGIEEKIRQFQAELHKDTRFNSLCFHESFSDTIPFKFLRIKIKNEIITMRQPAVNPERKRATDISPEELKHWLDEKRDLTLLDTRNSYEAEFGTFKNAVTLAMNDFSEFPQHLAQLENDKPIVMFCTGGIRCEKAALYLQQQGHKEVYQLDGGILGYFTKVGNAHYEGECFVFDERVAVNPELAVTGTRQCIKCQGPIQIEKKECTRCTS